MYGIVDKCMYKYASWFAMKFIVKMKWLFSLNKLTNSKIFIIILQTCLYQCKHYIIKWLSNPWYTWRSGHLSPHYKYNLLTLPWRYVLVNCHAIIITYIYKDCIVTCDCCKWSCDHILNTKGKKYIQSQTAMLWILWYKII